MPSAKLKVVPSSAEALFHVVTNRWPSRGLGEAMVGINVADLPAPHRLAERGW